MYQLEICAFTIGSCMDAAASGAHRIELCSNPLEGGTTPSYGMIKAAREKLDIDLFPIIRPRGGDFYYSSEEYAIMKQDILLCKSIGCNGVVIGLLNQDGSIDKKRTAGLVAQAYPMSVTFHRAFDRAKDPLLAMETIIDTGCERILSSGQQPTAPEGIGLLKMLVETANERIIIMPGSGLRSDNIREAALQTGATEFHASARKSIAGKMAFINESMKESLEHVVCDPQEVQQMVTALKNL